MPANARPQARNWCFTLNNPTDEDNEALLLELPKVYYGVWQHETGKEGTPHLQGYLAYKSRVRLATLKTLCPTAHWEIARRSPLANRKYCTKGETRTGPVIEIGDFEEIPEKGERSDLHELQTALDSGLTNDEYATNYFSLFVRYPKIVDAYQQAKIRPRSSKRSVRVILARGDSGTGKSRHCEAEAERLGGYYRFGGLGGFWDGYRGQPCVILDDFRGSALSFGDFKRICDRYSIRVGIKGTSCEMAATTFFITSNFEPENWWDQKVTGGDLTPIFRRITEVWYFPEFRKLCKFPNYREYAIAVLTPQRDGTVRTLPTILEVPEYQEDSDLQEETDL